MSVVFPEGIVAEGNVKVAFVPTVSDPSAPTVIEVAAGVDLSGYITAGQFTPSGEQARGENRRLGSKQTFQKLGRETPSIGDLNYVYDPQAAAADPENEAYETLTEDTEGFLVVRYGLDAEDVDFAAAQKVDLYPVQLGVQRKDAPPENDEFALLTVTQAVAVTGRVVRDVALV